MNERAEEVMTLIKQLNDNGIYNYYSGMKEFIKNANEFIKSGKVYSETIKFEEEPKLKLIVNLTRNKKQECYVRIKTRS